MQNYYHNTSKGNIDNTILGYLSGDGDFLTESEFDQNNRSSDPDYAIAAQIIVKSGLLSAGESYEQFCQRVSKIAAKYLCIYDEDDYEDDFDD